MLQWLPKTDRAALDVMGTESLTGLEGSVWLWSPCVSTVVQMAPYCIWQAYRPDVCYVRKDVLPLQVFPVPIIVPVALTNLGSSP